MSYTIDELIDFTEAWLIKGNLNADILADDFEFISPFWKSSDKQAFIDKFQKSPDYKKVLANIIKFEPIIKLKSTDNKFFTIVLHYFTKNGNDVWETVLGTVQNRKLSQLRSMYDLAETKKAHDLK